MRETFSPATIALELPGPDLRAAVTHLVDRLAVVHGIDAGARANFHASVLDRESDASTALGAGLAVPHGEWPRSGEMVGALGLCAGGLVDRGPDGEPIRFVALLGTSADRRTEHLGALAWLAGRIGADPARQSRLLAARTPEEVYERLAD